jgi:hypothetical protein
MKSGAVLLLVNQGLWVTGKRYNGPTGSIQTSLVTVPAKREALLGGDRKLCSHSRLQYQDVETLEVLMTSTDRGGEEGGGRKNDGSDNQSTCLNVHQRLLAIGLWTRLNCRTSCGGLRRRRLRLRLHGFQAAGLELVAKPRLGHYHDDMQALSKIIVHMDIKGNVGHPEIVKMLSVVRIKTRKCNTITSMPRIRHTYKIFARIYLEMYTTSILHSTQVWRVGYLLGVTCSRDIASVRCFQSCNTIDLKSAEVKCLAK